MTRKRKEPMLLCGWIKTGLYVAQPGLQLELMILQQCWDCQCVPCPALLGCFLTSRERERDASIFSTIPSWVPASRVVVLH